MESSFLQYILPFAILLFSFLFSSGIPKIYIFTLPLMALALLWCYPDWVVVQVAIWVIWIAYTWGNWRIVAFSSNGIQVRGALLIVLIVLSVVVGWLLTRQLDFSKHEWWKMVGINVGFGFLVYGFLYQFVREVIVPLCVKNRIPITSPLADYYKAPGGYADSKVWHSYIKFEGDPTHYDTGLLSFGRYRRKVGVSYSYIKYECLFGFSYITQVRQLSDTSGKQSAWDISPQTRTQRKVERFIVIFTLIIIAFGAIVVGLAVLLS